MEWAEEWLEKTEYNNEYEENILWTVEAIFKLNGKVNIHNAIMFMDHVMWGGVIDWAVLYGEGLWTVSFGEGL